MRGGDNQFGSEILTMRARSALGGSTCVETRAKRHRSCKHRRADTLNTAKGWAHGLGRTSDMEEEDASQRAQDQTAGPSHMAGNTGDPHRVRNSYRDQERDKKERRRAIREQEEREREASFWMWIYCVSQMAAAP